MDDLLAGLLAAIAEVLFEAVFETACGALASLLTRATSKLFKAITDVNPAATALSLGMLGALVGFLSVVTYPHALVHPSQFHGVSVIASPVLTGLAMFELGRLLRSHGRSVMPIDSFGYGFVFAFAMALVRFLMLR
jgi:hypothetical protein